MNDSIPSRSRVRPASSRTQWKRALLVVTLGIFCVAVFVVTAGYVFLSGLGPEPGDNGGTTLAREMPEPEPDERIHVLVLGTDAEQPVNGGGYAPTRTDTMILMTLDPLTGDTGAVFLPRDTYATIPGRPAPEKLSHAHAHGGVQLAIDTVSGLLNLPIHYYVRIDFKAFEDIIDTIGGVTIEVERRMRYSDPTQDLYIDIPQGTVDMDGTTALKYVRYRNGSDIERIGRQQQFIFVLLNQLLRVGNVTRIPALAEDVSRNVDTNMQPGRILSLARTAMALSPEDIDIDMLPGQAGYKDGLSYWFVDVSAMQVMVDEKMLGLIRESNQEVTVAVYNGGRVPGAATEVAGVLRRLGYDVVFVGNAPDQGDARYIQTRIESQLRGSDEPKVILRTLKTLLEGEAAVHLYMVHSWEDDDAVSADIRVYVGADFKGVTR